MANILAKLAIIGDTHLHSKNYGAHRDYPSESLDYLSKVTDVVERIGATHLIGTGDFSFGRFTTLEYREAVERELQKQNEITHGNRYELKGNHDKAGYGMTERDYYVNKGLLKPSENLTINNVHITMIDYGKTEDTIPNIIDSPTDINIVIAHDYYKFKDTRLPNFGQPIELDNLTNLFGMDLMYCGHIHKDMEFDGYMYKENPLNNGTMLEKQVHVNYLGCMMRPAYSSKDLDTKGKIAVVTIFDDGNIDTYSEYIDLWDIDKSFNLADKEAELLKKEEKANRIDISDVVKQLANHDRSVGDPESIIMSLVGVDEKYKSKAVELLKQGLG